MFDIVETEDLVRSSLDKVEAWVEDQNYMGYEPFDGLSSRFRPLTFGNLMGERILMQGIRRCPVNLRPLMGVKKQESTKGRGYMAWGYLYRHLSSGNNLYLRKAESCLDWLDQHKASKYINHSWSNHFDFSSRSGSYSREDPIIVWTALIGMAYLEAYEQTGSKRWLGIAESICRWIMELPRKKTDRGSCLSYLADQEHWIHNANMLGAAMLARTAQHTENRDFLEVARSAMEYSCERQESDGSWLYAEESKYNWVDNFHTGYNLDSLKTYMDSSGDLTWKPNLLGGLEYFKKNFFEADGRPKYYNNRCYPVDSQCAGQAIESLATFSDHDPDCLALSVKVARWTIENMQDPDGYFYYRVYPRIKAKTPMLHWSQGTIYKGLSVLENRLQKKKSPKVTPELEHACE